jgi:hypothetical protein
MREDSQSCADKIELGDELVKILVDSFVEMCQEVPHAKTAREEFLPPVAHKQKKSKNTLIQLTTLPRSPWRRTTLCHHPLEDAREAHGRPRITPPRHSH